MTLNVILNVINKYIQVPKTNFIFKINRDYCISKFLPFTWIQSIAVITILGDLDCVASSKGRKYFSASKLPALDFGKGRQEDSFASSLKYSNNTLLRKLLKWPHFKNL